MNVIVFFHIITLMCRLYVQQREGTFPTRFIQVAEAGNKVPR